MNLNHLFYFRILAQTENYTDAAKQLLISQPSLSYAIKNLESDLEVPLFKKTGRNVQLTSYGRELHTMAETVFSLVNQTADSIKIKRNIELNSITIGLIPTLTGDFLTEKIQKCYDSGLFTENHHIFHGFTSDIIEKVKSNIYDFGFCSKVDCPEITFIPIHKQPFILLINKELYEQEPHIMNNWFNMPIVTYRDTVPIGIKSRKIISTYTKNPNIIAVFDDEMTISGFVSAIPSIALIAKTFSLKQFDLPFIPLDETKIYHTVYLAYLTENEELKKIKDFKKLIEPTTNF